MAPAPYSYSGDGHFLERGHGLFGPVLLGESQNGVQDHDGQDNDHLQPFAQGSRNESGDDENDDHDLLELVQKYAPGFLGRFLD